MNSDVLNPAPQERIAQAGTPLSARTQGALARMRGAAEVKPAAALPPRTPRAGGGATPRLPPATPRGEPSAPHCPGAKAGLGLRLYAGCPAALICGLRLSASLLEEPAVRLDLRLAHGC